MKIINKLEKSETKVTRYTYGDDGYYVDIVKLFIGNGKGYYEAWLGNEKLGVSDMMFGCKETGKVFLSLVTCQIDDYIESFEAKYRETQDENNNAE